MPVNWEKIRDEYRVGQLSIRTIAQIYKVAPSTICFRASKYKWERDLTDKVRKQVNSKLLNVQLNTPHAREEGIVDEASDRGVQVILSHRKDIAKLRTFEQKLLDELDKSPKKLYITQYQGDIVQKEVELTVDAKAGALRDLAKVQEMRINLERQAFNLDERKEQNDGNKVFVYEHFLAALIIERKKIAEQKALPEAISEEKI